MYELLVVLCIVGTTTCVGLTDSNNPRFETQQACLERGQEISLMGPIVFPAGGKVEYSIYCEPIGKET